MISEEGFEILKKAGVIPNGIHYPKHIAFSMTDHLFWAKNKSKDIKEAYHEMFKKILKFPETQVKFGIPIITFYVLTSNFESSKNYDIIIDLLRDFFMDLAEHESIFKNKIKVSVFGKWYNLPSRVIDPIKNVLEETKEYDHFFLNLCINYDGQEEIVDACKLVTRRVIAEKDDISTIDKLKIKENLYSSAFLPPEIIIKTGKTKKLNGFLLWDSCNSHIYFSEVFWQDFTEKDLLRAINDFQNSEQ